MKEWSTILLNAALFKTEAYEWAAHRRDAFYLGFITIIAVALISGLLRSSATWWFGPARAPEMNVSETMTEVQRRLDALGPMMPTMPPAAQKMMLDQIEQGLELGMQQRAADRRFAHASARRPLGRSSNRWADTFPFPSRTRASRSDTCRP